MTHRKFGQTAEEKRDPSTALGMTGKNRKRQRRRPCEIRAGRKLRAGCLARLRVSQRYEATESANSGKIEISRFLEAE